MAARISKPDNRRLRVTGTRHTAGIRPDLARTLRWRAMDSKLSPGARHIVHVVTQVMARDGSGCHPPQRWISEKTGLCIYTVRKYLAEIVTWGEMEIQIGRGSAANVYRPAFDYDSAIQEYLSSNAYRRPDPQDDAYGSRADPRRHNNGSPIDPQNSNGSPIDPQGADAANSLGQNGSFMGQFQAVMGQPLTPTMDYKTSAAAAEHDPSLEAIKVQPADGSDNLLAHSSALAPFGDALPAMLEDFVNWRPHCDENRARADLMLQTGLYGSMNVSDAWSKARSARKAGSEYAYYLKTLSGLTGERGKREIPNPMTTESLSGSAYCKVMFGSEGL